VFGLTVLASNLRRDEETRRHGVAGAGEIGSYQLMMGALQALAGGFVPDGAVSRIEIGRVSHVRMALTEMKASMMAAELLLRFEAPALPTNLDDADLEAFTSFHANWDIAPFGGIDAAPGTPEIQLPDDAHADATDHILLEQ
jgi:hypothetical protein